MNKPLRQAPVFWTIFTGLIALGVLVGVLIPCCAVVQLLLVVQVVNGVLLPLLLVIIPQLVNNKEIMAEHTNGRASNALASPC